jgi:Bacterial SH3 domain
LNRYSTSDRPRAGSGSFQPRDGYSSVPWTGGRIGAATQRAAERLPRTKLFWYVAMAALVAAPLLVAGAFEQLPWQVDSWSRTAPGPGPPGAPPPGSDSSGEAIAPSGTPAGEETLANTATSPIAQVSVSTPAASPMLPTLTTTATITATATAVPSTLTPTPTEEADETGMIVTAPLNVRDAPGLDAAVREVLQSGTQVIVTGGPLEEDGHDWYQVSGDGVTGWAAGDFLEPV